MRINIDPKVTDFTFCFWKGEVYLANPYNLSDTFLEKVTVGFISHEILHEVLAREISLVTSHALDSKKIKPYLEFQIRTVNPNLSFSKRDLKYLISKIRKFITSLKFSKSNYKSYTEILRFVEDTFAYQFGSDTKRSGNTNTTNITKSSKSFKNSLVSFLL